MRAPIPFSNVLISNFGWKDQKLKIRFFPKKMSKILLFSEIQKLNNWKCFFQSRHFRTRTRKRKKSAYVAAEKFSNKWMLTTRVSSYTYYRTSNSAACIQKNNTKCPMKSQKVCQLSKISMCLLIAHIKKLKSIKWINWKATIEEAEKPQIKELKTRKLMKK